MKTNGESDYSYYLQLCSFRRQQMSQLQVYKACIIEATNGTRNPEEDHLNPLQQKLLEARRLISLNNTESAGRLIRKINQEIVNIESSEHAESKLICGDLNFISGTLSSLKGDFKSATQKMNKSAFLYEQANDTRRILKSLINEHICSSHHSLLSYENGVLYALKRTSYQNSFHDLLGNILRSHAFELLAEGKVPQSIHFAKEAQVQYLIDGYPDDNMTAIAIECIGHALLNDFTQAKNAYLKLNTGNSLTKIQTYANVVKDLLFGRIPNPSRNHPLARVPWKQLILKAGSLKNKLIAILRMGPQSRDQLILQLWGDTATHPSYNQRLHSLISEIREAHFHFIHFDGEFYSLI
ncbi:MAG: hypothetical protein ACXVCY_14540 [Pseudobdellovibrionaceae bacterium]